MAQNLYFILKKNKSGFSLVNGQLQYNGTPIVYNNTPITYNGK